MKVPLSLVRVVKLHACTKINVFIAGGRTGKWPLNHKDKFKKSELFVDFKVITHGWIAGY